MLSSRITDLQYLYDFTRAPFVLQYTVKGGDKARECRRWQNTCTVFTTSANWMSLRRCGWWRQKSVSHQREQPALYVDDVTRILHDVHMVMTTSPNAVATIRKCINPYC